MRLSDPAARVRAAGRAATFLLKLFPMLPSGYLDRVTGTPTIERVTYPTAAGRAAGDLYRPAGPGPHPGMVVCLGVVPFEVDHPQVPRLGAALARSGFAALLYWSPAMRDLRLVPEDVEGIALAYRWLIERDDVDPRRSGLLGTCVGGAFALMAAADPAIRDDVAFVAAFAPYSSMWTFVRDVASATRSAGGSRIPWAVDQLTRRVYVRSLTDGLEPREAELLRDAPASGVHGAEPELSDDGRAVRRLLGAHDVAEAQAALEALPAHMRVRLDRMSPLSYLADVHAPLIVFGHDRDDLVIPVGESRALHAALAARKGVHYTEFAMFEHADPMKRRLSPLALARELAKFFRYIFPLFRQAVAA